MMEHILVDRTIEDHEQCIRCVLHPFMISKGKLNYNSMLPLFKRGRKDASFLRLRYTDFSFCLHHGQNLAKEADVELEAFACITKHILDGVNNWANSPDSNTENDEGEMQPNGVHAELKGTPMSNGEYIKDEVAVYLDDETIELPMHADMLYDAPYEDEVKVQYREFARQLLKRVKFTILGKDIGQLTWKNEDEYNKYESSID